MSAAHASTPKPIGRRLFEGWLLVAARFGEIQTLIIVTLIYLFVVGPMSLGATAARRDLLRKRQLWEPGSAWGEADTVTRPDLERAKRLF